MHARVAAQVVARTARSSTSSTRSTATFLGARRLGSQAKSSRHLEVATNADPSPRARNTSILFTRSLSRTSAAKSTPMAAETVATDGITEESLASKLRETLNATYVSIEDMSGGCGQAFNAVIVSPDFEKKALLARHRLVNNALKAEIAAIHAWNPRCLTPEQWEKEKEKLNG